MVINSAVVSWWFEEVDAVAWTYFSSFDSHYTIELDVITLFDLVKRILHSFSIFTMIKNNLLFLVDFSFTFSFQCYSIPFHEKYCANKDLIDLNTPFLILSNFLASFLNYYPNHEKFKMIK